MQNLQIRLQILDANVRGLKQWKLQDIRDVENLFKFESSLEWFNFVISKLLTRQTLAGQGTYKLVLNQCK